MKRGILICLVFALVAACNEDKTSEVVTTSCGNGVLDNNEPCDGDLFASDLNLVCDNGIKPVTSKLHCSSSCAIDLTDACTSSCGNDTIDPGEECDGRKLPSINAPCDNADLSKLSCQACKLVDNGVCNSTTVLADDKCGNRTLDKGELCDGNKFADDAKSCPIGMEIVDDSKFKCSSSCNLVDISEACRPIQNLCGNGRIDGDEWCDGDYIPETLAFGSCPKGYIGNRDLVKCTDTCDVDTTNYCEFACGNGKIDNDEQCDSGLFVDPIPSNLCSSIYIPQPDAIECNYKCMIDKFKYCKLDTSIDNLIVFSEVVPYTIFDDGVKSIEALALELTNLSDNDADLSNCSLHVYYQNGSTVINYPLADIGVSGIQSKKSIVICSQDSDHFDGVCDYTISEKLAQDFIFSYGLLALECNDDFVDLFNLNSFLNAVGKAEAADFIRHCSHGPVSDPSDAKLEDYWRGTALSADAPKYGLGEHCVQQSAQIESCKYTVDRTALTGRDQIIHQTLDIKIPGISTLSDHTDAKSSIAIRFVTGKLRDNKVSTSNIHIVAAKPDESWVNADGVDRYIGELRNYDTYEGFIAGDEGVYVLDAAISFDNEETWYYCGPKGLLSDYSEYDAEERNRVDVSYEPSTCGDGRISGAEVCDGKNFIDGSLVCLLAGHTVTDPSKAVCSSTCDTINTNKACTPNR